MQFLGRLLLGTGVVLCLTGAAVLLFARMGILRGIPLGRLPGDLNWQGRNWEVHFPLATSVLLSILLSLVFYLLSRIRR